MNMFRNFTITTLKKISLVHALKIKEEILCENFKFYTVFFLTLNYNKSEIKNGVKHSS